MKKIFVNLCSYRDKFLESTLQSLIKTESGRNEITYGIFEQTAYEDSLIKKNPKLLDNPRIKYKRIDPEYSEGVMWARSVNSLQVEDEEFHYQIDSHMLFDQNWDHHLVMDFLQAKKLSNTDRIVLTAGTKNYKLVGDNILVKSTFDKDITCDIKFINFSKKLLLSAHAHWVPATDKVMPAVHIMAGNFFTTTKWLKDVGYNEKIFFSGEEQYLSLFSWLADYKIYLQRAIKVYHYMKSATLETKPTINPVISIEKLEWYHKRSETEIAKMIYSIDEDLLQQYHKETGIDYINRKLEPRIVSQFKPNKDQTEDWEQFSGEVDENL